MKKIYHMYKQLIFHQENIYLTSYIKGLESYF